jgi:hypothetical protein
MNYEHDGKPEFNQLEFNGNIITYNIRLSDDHKMGIDGISYYIGNRWDMIFLRYDKIIDKT